MKGDSDWQEPDQTKNKTRANSKYKTVSPTLQCKKGITN